MRKTNRGSITPAIIIISGAFLIVIYGLLLLLTLQLDFSHRQTASYSSLNIAEAGADYYRWHLLQDPTDFQDNTGGPGPYVHQYTDSETGLVGSYTLEITPSPDGSVVTVKSTGTTDDYPNIKRTVVATYGRESLTRYTFLHNSPIWFGNEVTLDGPVFSNGPIRMDGTNTSTVKSAVDTYTCGAETGCSQPTEKPGVWGNGGPQNLWEWPVPQADFASISIDFNTMLTSAQSSGLYLGPSTKFGYHLSFNAGGSFDVYLVNVAQSQKGYSEEYGCENLFETIKNESFLGSYNVSATPIIFVEDDVWVEGTLNGQTTVVAARFPIDTNNANIWVPNSMIYLDRSGGHKLGLIAQKDIIMTKDVPEIYEIDAALLTQAGRVIRHHYNWQKCKSTGDVQRQQLTIFGSVISNKQSYWNFSGGAGVPASGFQETFILYDPNLYEYPPGYFPGFGDFGLLNWREE